MNDSTQAGQFFADNDGECLTKPYQLLPKTIMMNHELSKIQVASFRGLLSNQYSRQIWGKVLEKGELSGWGGPIQGDIGCSAFCEDSKAAELTKFTN